MNYTEFEQRMRRQAWVEISSPAAYASLRYGAGQRTDFCIGCLHAYQNIIELRAKDWARMNGRKSKGFIPDIKFVDIDLTSEGKAAFKVWDWTDDDTIGFIERMGSEGYKIGSRYDSANGAWIASLTCNDKANGNYGWCLSARGRSFLHAFAIVAYKHEVLLSGDWSSVTTQQHEDDGWG